MSETFTPLTTVTGVTDEDALELARAGISPLQSFLTVDGPDVEEPPVRTEPDTRPDTTPAQPAPAEPAPAPDPGPGRQPCPVKGPCRF